nr:MAG TPA: hypothetical protein [Caudoviricetes sp.]
MGCSFCPFPPNRKAASKETASQRRMYEVWEL